MIGFLLRRLIALLARAGVRWAAERPLQDRSAAGLGFRSILALRYLQRQKPLSLRLHVISGICLALVLIAWGGEWLLSAVHAPWAASLLWAIKPALRWVKLGTLVGTVLVSVFVALIRRLTLFTTISTYGLFIGCGALVIALSIMSGFESDLRGKILGANAHITVQTEDDSFGNYEEARRRLAEVPGVVGASPFISSEVMIASSTNLSGVVMKGIDPATVASVNDLKHQLDAGELDWLAHPEKLLTVPTPGAGHDPEDDDAPADVNLVNPLGPDKKPPAKAPEKAPAEARPPTKETDKRPLPLPPEEPVRRVLPGVIVGRELAKELHLYPGDDVNLVSPLGGIGPSGRIPKSKPFRVAGIFFSGMFEYDSKYVYVAIPAAQKFLGMEDEVTGIELKAADPDRTERVVPAVEKVLASLPPDADGKRPKWDVQDWKQLNRNLFSALKLEKILMFVVLCFIILVAAFSIIANGIMLVLEKGREVAILKSMGAADRDVLGIFLLLGAFTGGVGALTGIVTGVLACVGLGHFGFGLDQDVYYITQLPVRLNVLEVLAVLGAALGIAILATLYPALVAARLPPVEGLRDAR